MTDLYKNANIGGGLFGSNCKKKYKLVFPIDSDHSSITTPAKELIDSLFPSSVLNSDAYKRIIELCVYINKTSPEEAFGQLSETILQITTATTAAIVSLGAGGDMVVNFIFTIKKALVMTAKIISIIDEMVGLFTVQEKDIINNTISSQKLSQTDQLLEDKLSQTKTVPDPKTVKFLSELFAIDFSEGPEGVKCRVEYIFKVYKSENTYEAICKLVQRIYPSLVQFVANMIGSSIPDVGVAIAQLIISFMKTNNGKSIAMGQIIGRLTKQYMKIPENIRKQIENPDALADYMTKNYKEFQSVVHDLFNHTEQPNAKTGGLFMPFNGLIKKAAKFSYDVAVKPAIKGLTHITGIDAVVEKKLHLLDESASVVIDNSKLIAYILHKMLALSFALLHTVKYCKI